MEYSEMDRKELMAAAKEAGIKGYAKMKTDAIVEALEGLAGEAEEVKEPEVEAIPVEEVKEIVREEVKKAVQQAAPAVKEKNPYEVDRRETEIMTDAQRLALIKADLTRREAVVITDMQRSQTTDDGEAPLEFFSYTVGTVEGNVWVNVGSDERQYIQRGILQVMADIPLDQSTQIAGKMTPDSIKFKTGKRFRITHVEGMTDEEIAEQIARENGRLKNA